jgi:hypothetical protein
MILTVSFAKTTYNALPYKFEAGTPNISGAIGLGRGVDFLVRWTAAPRTAARGRTARLCNRHAGRDRGSAHDRHGEPQGEPRVIRGRGRAPARPRNHPRPGRHRGAHRTSLRDAGHGFFQDSRRPRAPHSRSTTRSRRSTGSPRRSSARAACSPEEFAMQLSDLYRDVILDHNRQPRNFGDLSGRMRRSRASTPVRRSAHAALKLADDRITIFASRARAARFRPPRPR